MKKKYEYVHYVCVSTTKKPTSLVVTLKKHIEFKSALKRRAWHDNSLPKHWVDALKDVEDVEDIEHTHILHLQALEVMDMSAPKSPNVSTLLQTTLSLI